MMSPERELYQAIRNGAVWNESPYFFQNKNMPLHIWFVNSGYETVTSPSYCFHGLNRGSSEFTIFQYTVDGQGELEYEGRHYTLKPGDAFLVHLPHEHCYRFQPTENVDHWTHFYCSFTGREANRIARAIENSAGPVLRLNEDSACVKSCLSMILNLKEHGGNVTAYQASAWLYSFLMAMYSDATTAGTVNNEEHNPEFILKVHRFCLEHLSDPNIGVEDMAQHCGYSKFHFSRLFHDYQGISPGQYLRDLRLRAALRMLQFEIHNVKEIASLCGFTDESYFCRSFKRKFGQTPGMFRNQK